MHYKNGREAKAGDPVVQLSTYGSPVAGYLVGLQPGVTSCNAAIATVNGFVGCVTVGECLHLDDIKAATIPDSTAPPAAPAAPAGTDGPGPGFVAPVVSIILALLFLCGLSAHATLYTNLVPNLPAWNGTTNGPLAYIGQTPNFIKNIIQTSGAITNAQGGVTNAAYAYFLVVGTSTNYFYTNYPSGTNGANDALGLSIPPLPEYLGCSAITTNPLPVGPVLLQTQ